MTPYDALEALAEREAELVAAGDWVSVVELESERRPLLASLPDVPPPEAREILARTERRLRENAAAIAASLAQTRGELEQLRTARTALGPYAAAAPRAASALELKA